MLSFSPITEQNAEELSTYYRCCSERVSDYSLGIKLMWSYMLDAVYTVYAGCLIVRGKVRGRYAYDFPIPVSASADYSAAFSAMEEYCAENFIPYEFNAVPRARVSQIVERYPNLETRRIRNLNDYIYQVSDLASFSGKAYAGQRNHVRKFVASYPDAHFRLFTETDADNLHAFREAVDSEPPENSYGAKNERERAWQMLRFVGSPMFLFGGFVQDGRILSLCVAELCGDTMIDHVEKVLRGYEGIYPAMVQEFAKILPPEVLYINREDDAGNRGLRISKLQYHPTEILDKYFIKVKTELYHVEKIPLLETERLTLDAITEADIPIYNRISLDEERNRYWGYDYTNDCDGKPDENFFYLDQKKDFGSSTAMNFAIRLNGAMIGEVILYHFDFHGGAEVGIRLLEAYEKHGYAAEALDAACHYALYGIGLDVIRAKCFKENIASQKLLLSSMHQAGEDEQYYYFKRVV